MGDFSGYLDYFKFCFIYTWTSQTFLYRFGFSLQPWSSTIEVIYATCTMDAVRILKYLEENYNIKILRYLVSNLDKFSYLVNETWWVTQFYYLLPFFKISLKFHLSGNNLNFLAGW